MSGRRSLVTGAAWIAARLNDSQVAKRGGPFRLSANSIAKHASLTSMYVALCGKGWCVEVIGTTWLLYDPVQRKGRVTGFAGDLPILTL